MERTEFQELQRICNDQIEAPSAETADRSDARSKIDTNQRKFEERFRAASRAMAEAGDIFTPAARW
jgi:hypothetical protein